MRLSDSQRKLVDLLRRRGPMTVEDLSKAVGTTSVAVRQHLEVLAAEGLLESRTERRPVGRPRRVFRLSEAADELFPKNYAALAQMVLEHLETVDPERVEEVFRERRNRIAADFAP